MSLAVVLFLVPASAQALRPIKVGIIDAYTGPAAVYAKDALNGFKLALEEQLSRLREAGLTVLLAEQNVKSALRLSDRGYIIDNGQIRYQGSIEEIKVNEEVRKKYLLV